MIRVPSQKNKKSKKIGVRPGVFSAEVTGVVWTPHFREGDALDVTYLIDMDDEKVSYTETFFVKYGSNERVQKLNDLLDAIGAEVYEDFIGTKLEVTFLYEVTHRGKFLNIVDYRLDGDTDGCR